MNHTAPAGIDLDGVSRYFATHVPGGDVPLTVTLISGGRSNLTYRVAAGERAWVLRRPPLGHVLPTAHDMAREYRVITALWGTGVPVPRTVALCEDNAVNGAPFYVMDFVDGVIIADEIPAGFAQTFEERQAISRGLIETLVKLHAVDYNAVGLGDFGRPDGYLERQVRRWSEQWDRSETRPLPEIRELIRRLREAIPESPLPTIVHGDYRLGNMILDRANAGEVSAILDWEMCTLGDPLSDLGYTLCYWGQLGDDASYGAATATTHVTREPGFFTRAELVGYYGKLSGRDVSNIEFYQVLATYKLAVICEGIHARFLAGETVGEGFEGYGERTEMLIRSALEIADGGADPKLRGLS
ncbi:MAG: acyl-CoA dehydrogenase [Anaerolinea sp.]|nr:acyl-CoA dehydrogenase [Anaerolinea sp.]